MAVTVAMVELGQNSATLDVKRSDTDVPRPTDQVLPSRAGSCASPYEPNGGVHPAISCGHVVPGSGAPGGGLRLSTRSPFPSTVTDHRLVPQQSLA